MLTEQIEEKKKESLIVKYIKDRIYNKNKNCVLIFVGATGSGKSYSAGKLGEMLDKTFDVNRVSFKAIDFMNNINNLVEDKEAHKGKVIMWDELGVEHSAREFMTISNRVMNYFFQTSRHLNLIVIMTVPLLSFIDSNTRKLCHGVFEMKGINIQKKRTSTNFKIIQTNVISGKEYPKYLRYISGGSQKKITRVKFGLPSKEWVESYEKKKTNFTYGLNKDIISRLYEVDAKNNTNKKGFTEGSMQQDLWAIAIKGYKTQEEIRRELSKMYGKEVDSGQMSKNIISMRNKGLDIRDFRKK